MPAVNDPRNQNVAKSQRLESVHANPYSGGSTVHFRIFERVAGIKGGTSTSDFVETAEVTDWISMFARNSHLTAGGGGDPHLSYLYMSNYGVALWGGVCGMFVSRVDTPLASGKTGNIGALDAWCTIGSGADTITGLLYGVNATIGAEARSAGKVFTGTYYALFLASNWGTNCTVTQTASFIGCQDWGGGDAMPFLFDFDSLTAGTTNAIEQDTGAVGTPWGYARVICPDASVGYIVIYDGHS